MKRGCGILLPISALPNDYGFGDFSNEAYEFVDYLKDLGVTYWQILPIGIADNGGSPYCSESAFAGEPSYINIEKYLTKEELLGFGLTNKLTYNEYRSKKLRALKSVYKKLGKTVDISDFIEQNEKWVYDYAVFSVLGNKIKKPYVEFPEEYKDVKSEETKTFINENAEDIYFYIFLQYLFFKQWFELKEYANKNGIMIIGDIPIYCSFNCVEMYANKKIFLLDENEGPKYVSGVPGDYFNPDGQIWGNPLYDYDYMKKTDYDWWVRRVKHLSKLYDYTRIDHFRGFDAFFEIPYGDGTVEHGAWVKGPGIDIFNEFSKCGLGNLILEDLGDITEGVRRLKEETGFPGMKVMQFAFDGDPKNLHLPHVYEKNSIAYIGTHDNDTLMGLLKNPREKFNFCKYFGVSQRTSNENVVKIAIDCLLSTDSNVCVITMQDILCQGSEARINTPGKVRGNWCYKMPADYREHPFNKYLKELIKNKNR